MTSRVLSTLFIQAVLAGLLPGAASAQDPGATYACDPKAGTLVIRYIPSLGEAKPPPPKTPAPIAFMSLMDINQADTTLEGTRATTATCRLKSDRFEMTFEPGVPNTNLLGRCGAAITGVVTITRNGVVVIKEQEFEDMNCHARERMLERITFTDGSPKPKLDYVSTEP